MTEEKSVLKTRLGLENLKGLGETLTQIREVKESLDEAQKTISELAKDNSPMGKALAQLIEAHGIKALNEDNVIALEEVKNKMGEELEKKDQAIEALAVENRELKEDKVVREVKDSLAAELDRRLPKPGDSGNGSGESRLFKALEDVVADYLQKRLLGGGGEGNLSSEQIRSIVKEEVGQVAGGNKKPEDMVDDIVNALTMGDRLREKLGMPSSGSRLLPATGNESGLRTDLVKALLEDERERLKIQNDREAHLERNKHIGTLVGTFKENAEDLIGATRDLSHLLEDERKTKGGGSQQEAPQGFNFKCSQCGDSFTLDEEPQEEFPCPGCGTKLQIKKPGPQVASSLEI